MAYRDALGLAVEPVHTYDVGRHCVVGADRFACWALFRQEQLSAWAWLRSWLGARQMLFSWDDPLPGFARILEYLWVAGTRKLGRLGGTGS
jgi:hypothetical protein